MHTHPSSTSILMMDSECDEPMPGSSSEPVVDVDSGQARHQLYRSLDLALCFRLSIHCLCTICVVTLSIC